MQKIGEECGVFGIWSPVRQNLAYMAYYALFALQHRGQEAAGIAVNDDGVFRYHRDLGLVHEVFGKEKLDRLGEGHIAVGHTRYSTSGISNRSNAQPVVVRHIKGSMALCHNGNLVNSLELREELENEGCIFHSTTDTEVISYLITRARLHTASIEEAVNETVNRIHGAFSLVIMSPTKLIAVRDPHGFRPLCYGMCEDGSVVFASESCALDAVGAKLVRDLAPGEIVVADPNGVRSIKDHCGECRPSLCVFEYIYFARPDSVIDGSSVHEARLRAGSFLALEHPVQADVVIGVPDSGLDAALGFARQSGIPYGIGLLKNKYIGRTFISPGQAAREDLVKIKLNPIAETVKGKRVVLIDDSIVRGTTSQRIVKLVRDAGATEVHFRVSSPAFLNPCYYGTDIDSRENLIACQHTNEEIAKMIGADSLGYLSVESAKRLAKGVTSESGFDANGNVASYCAACFDGVYPTEVPESGKDRFEQKIPKEWLERHTKTN
ncbi:amidophosphoribosyltransferase [Lachnospiraceae bacterium NK3A20]|jgi:amidophosphoribosyltransferase|nr:amidophosphoribosyltransferase [Lachnospiraceae bacterium NK3A20]